MNQKGAILITGAAQRIGRAVALYLAHQGYDIAIHYRNSEEAAAMLEQEIKALGRKTALIQADLAEADATAVIRQAQDALPHLNGLILNASLFEEANFLETDEAVFDANMGLHLKAPYFLSQAYAKQVGKGSIITFLDTYITKQSERYFTYLLSKKALAELTRMLAKSLAPAIRVNAIAPGLTLPSGPYHGEEAMEARKQIVPLGRLGTPEDIAHAAQYLLEAEYLVGQTLFIDGGEQLT